MIERRFTDIVRPADGPMDLNAGKPNAKDALHAGGFTLVALFVAALGALIISWAIPKDPYDGLSAVRIVGIAFGALVALFAFRFAWNMGRISIEEWQDYQARKSDWHLAQLEAYKALRGVEHVREYREFEIQPSLAKDLLVLGIVKHYQITHGQHGSRTLPWSVRGLEEKIYLDSGKNAILIGELTGTNPEKASQLIHKLGWVRGRTRSNGGQWSVESYDQLIEQFINNWNRAATQRVTYDNET